jgi:hypothetical protein
MTDVYQVENMLDNTDLSSELKHQFTSLERAYVLDCNNGDYSTGYIQIDGSSLRDSFLNYADAELWIPLTITNASFTGPLTGSKYGYAPGGGEDIIRWKGSVLSLIGDIVIKNNNDSVLKESLTYYGNTIRIPLEHSLQWYNSGDSQMLCYSLDDASNIQFQTTTHVYNSLSNGPLSYTINAGSITSEPPYLPGNNGILKGANDFFSQFNYIPATHSYTGEVIIKLKQLSSFFEQLDFPLSANFTLYFYFNFKNASPTTVNMPPLQLLTSSGTVPTYTNIPNPMGGNTTISIGNSSGTACRLYYKSCKFNSEMGKKIASMYENNSVKNISFITTEVQNNLSNISNNNNQTQLISPLVKRVQRLFLLGYDHTNAPLNTWTSNGPGFVDAYVVNLNNLNIKLNNRNYYDQNLTLNTEFFDETMQCTATYGFSQESHSLISLDTWYNANSTYVFDLTRINTRMGPESEVSVQVVFTNTNVNAVDYVFLIERLVKMRIKFTDKGAQFHEY